MSQGPQQGQVFDIVDDFEDEEEYDEEDEDEVDFDEEELEDDEEDEDEEFDGQVEESTLASTCDVSLLSVARMMSRLSPIEPSTTFLS